MTPEAAKIQFGGRERTLRFRPSLVGDFERLTGSTLMESLPNRGFNTLATLLWCAFKKEDDKLSVNKVMSYLDDYVESGGEIGELWEDVAKALINGGIVPGRDRDAGKADAPTS